MPITTEDNIAGGFVGDGTTNAVTTPAFQKNADIRAVQVTDATGAELVLTLDTDYTLTGVGNPSGGSLTPLAARPVGTTLYVTVDPLKTQEANIAESEPTTDALDKLTQIIQQMQLEIDRSFKLPEADRLAGSVAATVSGAAAGRTFTYLGFDENGAFGVRDIFGGPSLINASFTYSPSTHFGRHLIIDVDNNDVVATLPNASTIQDGIGFWLRVNDNTNTASITVAVSGQLRSQPMNGFLGHVADTDTVYMGYHSSVQASSYAYVWKETTNGGSSIWQVAGLIRDGLSDDYRLTSGGGGGGAVDSVVGQTGTVTAAQIKTAIDAESDTNFLTDAERTKLTGIETSATADQTGAEIKTLYESEADTNAFTDAEQTKLAGIESSATADQSDAEIETAYNNQVAVVDQSTAEAGASTTVFRWTPQRVGQAIAALAGGGTDDQTASEVPFTPAGDLVATDVQAALEELDSEKTLASALTTIARADIDQDADLLLVWDDSAGELKSITYEALSDLEINRPSANFQIDSTTRPNQLFAPTGGDTCTIAAMRLGQAVPFRNTSGGTYTFAASGVTITGDITVGNNLAATIEAITATSIFITAEA